MLNTAPEPIDFGTPLSVQAILDRAVTSRPTATALVGKRGRLRYDELDRTASQVA